MSDVRPGGPPPPWASAVTVEDEVELAEEIRRRVERASRATPLTVSDLLGPRRAYWRRRAPTTPIAEDRQARMLSGRAEHARLIEALPGEGLFEVRLRRDGVSGRIDLLADVPVEVKTGARVDPSRLRELRPDHVEQIVLYCVLADRTQGRVVTLDTGEAGEVRVQAVDLTVSSVETARRSMARRSEALRAALDGGSPDRLPACRWFGRRCEFEEARVCGCTGAEPPGSTDLLESVAEVTPNREVEGRWTEALRRPATSPAPEAGVRFRELIYPRRAFFDRTRPRPPREEEAPAPERTGPDLYARLVEGTESGPLGEVARLPPAAEAPPGAEEVAGFRGHPYLVRTSRAWDRIRPSEALARFPQYALELGLRSSVVGSPEGRVFLAYERAEDDRVRFQVLRYRFASLAEFRTLEAERRSRLRAAVAANRPDALEPCPDWMYDGCPYRPECACAAEPGPGRSHR